MRVVYLTWGETPRSYGVYGNQVINQFVKTCQYLNITDAYFLAAVPILHSGFFRERFSYYDEISKVKSTLGAIKFIWIPIYATQNFVNSNANTFKLMHGFAHYHLLSVLSRIKPDIVHCRSYHAAWAANQLKERFCLTYKVIFDGRDMWPEEMALKLRFDETSRHYNYLKAVEKYIIERSDFSVSVSVKMHEYYSGLGARRDRVIYLSSDVKNLFKPRSFERNFQRDGVNFCYLGALSDSTWHKTTELAKLFSKLSDLFPTCNLTIITASDHSSIRSIFSKFNLTRYSIKTTKTIYELKDILSNQDFGLMSYFVPANELQKNLGDILLSIKAVEYFSAGLPMICNRYCGEISYLIEQYDLGISYSPENFHDITFDKLSYYLNDSVRERCYEFALSKFDFSVSAKNYAKLYCDAFGG